MELKHLILKWAFYYKDKQFFGDNKERINEINLSALNHLNDLAVVMFGAFYIYIRLTKNFIDFSFIYLIYFIIFFILLLIYRQIIKPSYIVSNLLIYFTITILYSLGIYIGCIVTPPLVSVMFPVFLICLPLIFILPPVIMSFYNIVLIAIFLFFSHSLKPNLIASIDQINIIACFLISVVTSYIVNCARIKEIAASIQLELVCNIDEITKLHNRRSFNKYIIDIFHHPSSDQLTLMMIDVDNFKDYNDSYGHICGDNCLISIGNAFRKIEEKYGCYIARYGGEEFVLVDSTHSLSECVHIAKELIRNITDIDIEHINSNYKKITISVGISNKANSNARNYIDLINLADDALYQAKSNGKNTLMVASHSANGLSCVD